MLTIIECQERIGAWLAEERCKRGLTQWAVADRLGEPQSFVARFEGGKRKMGLCEIVQICNVIGADPRVALWMCECACVRAGAIETPAIARCSTNNSSI